MSDFFSNDQIIQEVIQEFGNTSNKQILIKRVMELILDTFGYDTACIMLLQSDKTLIDASYYGKSPDHLREVENEIKKSLMIRRPMGKVQGGVIPDDIELGEDCRIKGCCTIFVALKENRTAHLFLMDSRHTQELSRRETNLLRVGLHPLCSLAVLLIEYVIIPEDCEGVYRLLPLVLPLYEKRMHQARVKESKGKLDEMIIGESKSIEAVKEQILNVSQKDVTVLIRGETGTGKELVARAIHELSSRSSKPFIPVNCAALPEGLIESELFGHERGAFPNAYRRREGRFELANSGTIFLDEIGTYSQDVQIKLLRVLQERTFERVGGTEGINVDIRLITVTNENLELLVKERKFREDLYYRINVFSINLPPLRERDNDILLLAERFLESFCDEYGKQINGFSREAKDCLTRYRWPGNVRELENTIARAVIISKNTILTPEGLPGMEVDTGSDNSPQKAVNQKDSFLKDLSERQIKVLEYVKDNGSIANREHRELFGMSPNTAHEDLSDLVQRDILKTVGKGRNAHYVLSDDYRMIIG